MELALDPAWTAGLVLAILRTTGFVLSSPIFPAGIPVVARVGVAIGLGLFWATPFAGSLSIGGLVGAAVVNIGVGVILGHLTLIVFSIFPMAGGLIDVTSGMGIAAVLDPNQGIQAALFNRLFTMAALAMFMLIGGDAMLIHGIGLSMEMIPLDGTLDFSVGLLPFVMTGLQTMMVAAAELALPTVAALFMTEVVLGLASRFAPTANVFVLGLPLRLLLTLSTVGVTLSMFPGATRGAMRLMREAIVAGLRGMGAG